MYKDAFIISLKVTVDGKILRSFVAGNIEMKYFDFNELKSAEKKKKY